MEANASALSEVVVFLGSMDSLINFIEAVCVSVSAISAALLYRHTTINAKRAAMVQMLIDRGHDARLIEAEKRVRNLYKTHNSSLKQFVDKDDEDRASILIVLNNLEFLSSGVNIGAFDEEVFKRMQYSNVMRSWQMTKDFIETLRANHGNTTYFQDFEVLASRWRNAPLENIRQKQPFAKLLTK